MMDRSMLRVVPPQERNGGRKRKGSRRKKAVLILIILTAALGVAVWLYLQTFHVMQVSETYAITNAADSSYQEFGRGILKYSRDGISYLNQRGEEQWNQSYQMQNPFVKLNDTSVVAADKGGNDMMIFQESGLKGEIHTTLPIEKVTVSGQGIVGAVLKNGATPMIMCYDMAGNILVEQKASIVGNGYPMDIALSENGKLLQVVYLSVEDGQVISRVGYYNFGSAGEGKTDRQVYMKDYEDSVFAAGFFMNGNVSAIVGDHTLLIFKGEEEPKLEAEVRIEKNIQSICYNKHYIGLILKNEGRGGYEVCMYNTSGKKVMSQECAGTYSNVKLSGSNMILYDGSKCCIYTRIGRLRFEGEADSSILEISPAAGIHNYVIMDANGMEKVRLVE